MCDWMHGFDWSTGWWAGLACIDGLDASTSAAFTASPSLKGATMQPPPRSPTPTCPLPPALYTRRGEEGNNNRVMMYISTTAAWENERATNQMSECTLFTFDDPHHYLVFSVCIYVYVRRRCMHYTN